MNANHAGRDYCGSSIMALWTPPTRSIIVSIVSFNVRDREATPMGTTGYEYLLVLRSSINSAIGLVMGVFHGQKVGEI